VKVLDRERKIIFDYRFREPDTPFLARETIISAFNHIIEDHGAYQCATGHMPIERAVIGPIIGLGNKSGHGLGTDKHQFEFAVPMRPAHTYSAAISAAAPRSTETSRLTPCSTIVTPNRRCMRLIVAALWVTIR